MAVHRLELAVAWLLMSTLLVSGSPVGDCPPVDPLDHTDHLPDDKNCSLFYKCDHASPVLFSCPDGLHFNILLEVCDWPDAAGCTGNSGSSPTEAPSASPNTGPTPAPSTTDKPASDAPSISTSRPAKQCPAIGTCPQYEDETSIAKHLPHATNCSQFCKCDHGRPVTFDCPAGLHFNAILEVCDWPQNARCSRKPTTDAPSTTAKLTTAVPITTAELTTAAPTTSLRTTTAASSTTLRATTVVQTTVSERTTAAQSETTKVTTAAPSTTSEPTTTAPRSTTKPTTSDPVSSSTAAASSPATSNSSGECPAVGVCPRYEDEKSIAKHLPHATNCSQFCKCDHGKPVTFDCPAGLHFNSILEVCDWPQNARCSAGPTTAAPSNTVKRTTAVPITRTTPTTTAKPNTAAPSKTSVPTTAAPSTSAKTTSAAPSTISKSTTVAPTTTYGPTTAAPVSSTTSVPSSPSTSNPSEECPAVGVCPQYEDDKSIAKHLPHATNCSQFCKCDHGKPVTFDCPAGLHFNAILEVCDWPQNAGCSARTTTDAPSATGKPTTNHKPAPQTSTTTKSTTAVQSTTVAPTTSVKSTTAAPSRTSEPTTVAPSTTAEPTTSAPTTTARPTTHAQVSPSTSAPTSPETSEPSGECPAVGVCPQYEDEKLIAKHLPHATNCSQFCKCDHGTPVTFDCPAGLHFNTILEVCDWPQSAGCSGKPTTVAPSTTVKQTTAAPITTVKLTSAAPSSTASPNVEPCDAAGSCPVYDQQSTVKHLPHRTNCGLYCRCNHGVPITEKCPNGLHFNAILEVCDWPYNAGCQ